MPRAGKAVVYVSAEVRESLRALAAKDGVSMGLMVERLVQGIGPSGDDGAFVVEQNGEGDHEEER